MNGKAIHCVLVKTISNVHVAGVFPKDEIPKNFPSYPACLVANTDVASDPGEHWVALYFPNAGLCEFFDSFGGPPSVYDISIDVPKIQYSNVKLQSDTTTVCGHYCIYFLLRRCLRRESLFTIGHQLDIMHTNSTRDPFILNFIRNLRSSIRRQAPCTSKANCPISQCCTSKIHWCEK